MQGRSGRCSPASHPVKRTSHHDNGPTPVPLLYVSTSPYHSFSRDCAVGGRHADPTRVRRMQSREGLGTGPWGRRTADFDASARVAVEETTSESHSHAHARRRRREAQSSGVMPRCLRMRAFRRRLPTSECPARARAVRSTSRIRHPRFERPRNHGSLKRRRS